MLFSCEICTYVYLAKLYATAMNFRAAHKKYNKNHTNNSINSPLSKMTLTSLRTAFWGTANCCVKSESVYNLAPVRKAVIYEGNVNVGSHGMTELQYLLSHRRSKVRFTVSTVLRFSVPQIMGWIQHNNSCPSQRLVVVIRVKSDSIVSSLVFLLHKMLFSQFMGTIIYRRTTLSVAQELIQVKLC